MSVATSAKVIAPSAGPGGTGNLATVPGAVGGAMPVSLYGAGTPDGTIFPWKSAPLGSTYVDNSATAGNPNTYTKTALNDAVADWVLPGTVGLVTIVSDLVDISAADSEMLVYHAVTAAEVLEAGLLWEEASQDDTGVHEGDVTIGTTSGGGEIVAATLYGDAQAAGSYQALSLASGALAAGSSVYASHDQSTGAGTYRLILKIRIEA